MSFSNTCSHRRQVYEFQPQHQRLPFASQHSRNELPTHHHGGFAHERAPQVVPNFMYCFSCPSSGPLSPFALASLVHRLRLLDIIAAEFALWQYPPPFPFQVNCISQQLDPYVALDRSLTALYSPPTLSQEEAERVKSALFGKGRGNRILAKSSSGDSVKRSSMQTLRPGEWLNDDQCL